MAMTEKELRKLKRGDFLQLLLAQSKDLSAVQDRLDEMTAAVERLQAANDRLTVKIDEKDEMIKHLQAHLEDKDDTISALRAELEEMKASRWEELEKATAAMMAQPFPETRSEDAEGKDELIGMLKARIESKDKDLDALRAELDTLKSGIGTEKNTPTSTPTPAAGSLNLEEVFGAARETADRYLHNIRLMHDELVAKLRAARTQARAGQKPAAKSFRLRPRANRKSPAVLPQSPERDENDPKQ